MAMDPGMKRLIIFTDLDGCLLNKHDYDWSPAAPTLRLLQQRQIPVIMNSSKTVPEMQRLSKELGLHGSTFISENGAVICWGQEFKDLDGQIEVIGEHRDKILSLLWPLKSQFRFRSFDDLGLAGVVKETQLPEDRARQALQRQGTEPLLWDDTEQHRRQFELILQASGLTMTKGGRFWHVAGQTTKGRAMQIVGMRWAKGRGSAEDSRLSLRDREIIMAAVGDSPIDQSMLDQADVPIGIPAAAGLGVQVDPVRGIIATQTGSTGWAEAMIQLLARIDGAAESSSS